MPVLKIPGFDYTIDEQGRIFSLNKNKFISVAERDNGRISVRLYRKGKVFTYSLHSLYNRVFKKRKLIRKLYTDLDGEVWKPVPIEGFSSRYFVSNLGRVKSRVNNHEKLLAYNQGKRGGNSLLRVGFSLEKKRKYFYVYSLVLAAFRNLFPEDYNAVKYLDHNIHNNHIDNLKIIYY